MTLRPDRSASDIYREILADVRKERRAERRFSRDNPSREIADRARFPYMDYGACPFECCQYGEWVAKKRTPIVSDMSEDSPVSFYVEGGEHVLAETGVVVTARPGLGEVDYIFDDADIHIGKGELVTLIHYQGEGFWKALYEHHEISLAVNPVVEPATTWWARIKNGEGKTGWSARPDDYGNKDGCG